MDKKKIKKTVLRRRRKSRRKRNDRTLRGGRKEGRGRSLEDQHGGNTQ